MPPDIDLRALTGAHVLDQGPRPTCVPFATTVAHEALRTTTGHASTHLAPEALWHHCTNLGLTSAHGMVLDHVGLALGAPGQPELHQWPYNSTLDHGTEPPPTSAGAPPWNQALLRALSLGHDGIEQGIEDALAHSQPVVIVVEVTDEFLRPDVHGFVAVPNIRVVGGSYHAVTRVGAATHPSLGRFLLMKNSWGPTWGLGGYAWVPVRYLVAFAVQAATVVPQQGLPR